MQNRWNNITCGLSSFKFNYVQTHYKYHCGSIEERWPERTLMGGGEAKQTVDLQQCEHKRGIVNSTLEWQRREER